MIAKTIVFFVIYDIFRQLPATIFRWQGDGLYEICFGKWHIACGDRFFWGRTKIRKEKIISESTLQNIRNGKRITTDSIAALCEALNCQPGDLLEYIPDTEATERDTE